MTRFVVLDTTVLINFAQVNRPNLIARIWPGIAFTTETVMREYRAGVVSHQLPENCWDELAIVDLTFEESELAARLPKTLGEGERTCLSVAEIRGGSQRQTISPRDASPARLRSL